MSFHPSRLIALASLMLTLMGCAATLETQAAKAGLNFSTPIPTYSCVTNFAAYDSLAACQTASHANCTSTWESFPSGGVALCYFPPAGYTACLVTPVTWDWIYTPYSAWCDTTPGAVLGSKVFQKSRSVIGCSSSLCTCTNSVDTSLTCTGGACAAYAPDDPTAAAPTPAPCSL
jgi:hypothetical protein